jgi:hypothetical protein
LKTSDGLRAAIGLCKNPVHKIGSGQVDLVFGNGFAFVGQ